MSARRRGRDRARRTSSRSRAPPERSRAPPAASLIVAEKSTVPAGTADRIHRTIALERRASRNGIEVVSNPEFLREGTAIEDALRARAGSSWGRTRRVGVRASMRRLYAAADRRGVAAGRDGHPDGRAREARSNAFLALKISYVNALARVCERTGADVDRGRRRHGLSTRGSGARSSTPGSGTVGSASRRTCRRSSVWPIRLELRLPAPSRDPAINDEAVEAVFDEGRGRSLEPRGQAGGAPRARVQAGHRRRSVLSIARAGSAAASTREPRSPRSTRRR